MKLNPSIDLAASHCPEPYHFPPDLFDLLVDTIPRLCRSKRSVVLFFRGAGVADCTLDDIEADLCRDHLSHSKFAMVRTVLERLNVAGDRAIKARREVIKRVVEFEDFTRCWEKDELVARGLVGEVRRIVAVKDSFTRMRLEREHERQRRIQIQSEKDRERRERIEHVRAVRGDLFALFAERDAYKRALKLEAVLNRLFAAYGILIREAFKLRGAAGEGVIEQIDGVIEFQGRVYLVEVKWWNKPLGVNEIAPHMVRIFRRHDANGMIISDSGFTEPAVSQCRDVLSQKTVVLSSLHEIVNVLYEESDLVDWLRKKVNAAIVDKNPFLDTTGTRS